MFQEETSRANFMKTTAIAGAAAVTASFGFNRMASAAHHEESEMITQLAIFKYKAEEKEAAIEGLAKLAAEVEKVEPGVLAYMPHLDEANSEVVFFEIYKDAAALANHGTQPHMAWLRPMFGKVFMPPLKIVKLNQVGGYYR